MAGSRAAGVAGALSTFCAGVATPARVLASESVAPGGRVEPIAILTFLLFVSVTLVITAWAARRTHNTQDFYAAGGRITAWQNALAIAGDFISASTFLGFTGLVFVAGFDVSVYIVSAIGGLCLLLILIAEPFRNLGRYTFPDVVSCRLKQRPVRIFLAISSLTVLLLYLVSQMVAAGALIQLLFDIPYPYAVVIIGALMTIYVSFGGMIATTWVQIIKAALMLLGIGVLSLITLYHFDFSLNRLYNEAARVHHLGYNVLAPGGLLEDPVSVLSLALASIFGTVAMPHILMRLYTVADGPTAYRSVYFSAVIMSCVFVLIFFVVGFGAIPLLHGHPELLDEAGNIIGGSNMVTIHLARVVAGDVFLGFISGIVFATILAVVSGLTLTGAATLSHDLYASVLRRGQATEQQELRVSRLSTVGLGAVAIFLGMLFEGQNIAYMISMVFVVTASANCPILLLGIYWRRLTTRGAILGGVAGLVSAVGLMVVGPTIWVEILGNATPIFPYKYPGLYSVPAGFFFTWLFSILDRSPQAQRDRERYDSVFVQLHLGQPAGGGA